MNRNLALRYLCWKEVRQVLPLVWMQLALGICFQLLFLLQPNKAFVPRFLVFAGMPGLFALGVGALLVGQEKERRTLDWLRSLPIAAGDLVAVKLATGLVALIAVWCLNLLLLAIFVFPTGRWPVASPADSWLIDAGWAYLWPLQSVFLLLAGFTTAWTFRSSLVALLALIPLTLLPGVATSGLNHVVRWPGSGSILNDPAPWMTAVVLIVLSAALLVVGWRRGMKSLSAEQVSEKRFSWSRVRDSLWGESAIWARPMYSPAAMLIWQFVRQNQTVLTGIAAMLLVALGLLVTTPPDASGRPVLAAFCGLLAASWLGVLAFQGDGVQDRIRFLAERGVSPAKIWWTRHAPALSLLAMTLLLMVFFLPTELRSSQLSAPGILFVAVAVLFTYGVSQAVGQVFRSSAIAAIAAPVAAWGLVAYGGSVIGLLGVPYWLLALCASLPWLATFLLMRRWTDGRLGWGFWGAHAGFLAAVMVLPLIPAELVLVSRPTMPAEVRRQLTAEAQSYGPTRAEPRELVLRFRNPEATDVLPADRRVEGRIVCEQLAHDLSLEPGPIRFTPRVMVYLLGEARLARMVLEQDGDAALERERYRRTLSLIGTLVERLRLSWKLLDQDGADLIEIWLVNELALPDAEAWLGSERYGRLVRMVSDTAGRNAARRRAVVMSWAVYRTRLDAPENLLGGYPWLGEETSILYRVNPFIRQRAADYLTWRMLQRLDGSEPAENVERTKELARYWGVPELYYGLGPDGEYLRAEKPTDFAMPVEGVFRSAPGSQWHAGWERAARELVDRLDVGHGEHRQPTQISVH